MRNLLFFTLIFLWLNLGGISVKVNAQITVEVIKRWDYLEVSNPHQCYVDNISYKNCRSFYFYNFGTFDGKNSLDWIGVNGWELVSVAVYPSEGNTGDKLIFKRPYNPEQSKREIENLKRVYEAEPKLFYGGNQNSTSDLIDLDATEAKDNLAAFNKQEEEKLGQILRQLNKPNVKLLRIKSLAYNTKQTRINAELVIDGTAVLLKDGNKYRKSEARKYLQDIGREFQNLPGLRTGANNFFETRFAIGEFGEGNYGINIGLSVVINYQGKQNIVAQGWANFNWADSPN